MTDYDFRKYPAEIEFAEDGILYRVRLNGDPIVIHVALVSDSRDVPDTMRVTEWSETPPDIDPTRFGTPE